MSSRARGSTARCCGPALIDELVVYLAPAVLGDPARGMFDIGAPLASLAARVELEFTSIDRIGDDVRLVARVRRQRIDRNVAAIARRNGADVHRNRAGHRRRSSHAIGAATAFRMRVDARALDTADIAIGESVAVSGLLPDRRRRAKAIACTSTCRRETLPAA
jgi:hypothetical protein